MTVKSCCAPGRIVSGPEKGNANLELEDVTLLIVNGLFPVLLIVRLLVEDAPVNPGIVIAVSEKLITRVRRLMIK